MLYYAIQVKTGEEDQFIERLFKEVAPDERDMIRLFAPKRKMHLHKGGRDLQRIYPIFPSYVFLETESLTEEQRWAARRVPGFYRFLKTTRDPTPLSDHDRQLLLRFVSFGDYADVSTVSFDENDRIVVIEGPMQGLEGNIVKMQ